MRRYPGLSPFSKDQKDIFFGRDKDIKELSKLIFVETKVLLYSRSGYGKSSLLNAGIEPELTKNNDFKFIKIRFSAYKNDRDYNVTPNDNFLQTIRMHKDFMNTEKQSTIIDLYAKDYENEYWLIFMKNQLAGNNSIPYILVFDQLEELFTYPIEQIIEFKNKLSDILLINRQPSYFTEFEKQIFNDKSSIDKSQLSQLYQPINIKTIFSIRSDKLSELNKLTDKIPDIQKVFYELRPLTIEQARQAIAIPSNKNGEYESLPFTYQPDAISKIISELTINENKEIPTTQLQIVCHRIEEDFIPEIEAKGSKSKKQKELILIDNDDFIIEADEIPDFKDLFLNFYDEAVAKVKTNTAAKVQQFIEDQLIINKRRVSLDQHFCLKYVNNETLKTLVDKRMIRPERNSVGSISYELSHDVLIRPIAERKEQRTHLEDLRKAKEKADKERVESEVEAKRQAILLALQKGKAEEAERAKQLAEKNLDDQRKAARKQQKLLRVVFLIALLAGLTSITTIIFWTIAGKRDKEVKKNLAKSLIGDADKLYNKEDYLNAYAIYERLQNEDLLEHTNNQELILNRINSCIHYDSIKKLFDPKFSLADSLIEISMIDELLSADSLIRVLSDLNYVPAKNKFEALKFELVDNKIKLVNDMLKDVKVLKGVPDKKMYPRAEEVLLEILRLEPEDQESNSLLIEVQRELNSANVNQ